MDHTYQAYSIDLQAEANQLRVGVPVPSNVSADNPFNFTLGFGPDKWFSEGRNSDTRTDWRQCMGYTLNPGSAP